MAATTSSAAHPTRVGMSIRCGSSCASKPRISRWSRCKDWWRTAGRATRPREGEHFLRSLRFIRHTTLTAARGCNTGLLRCRVEPARDVTHLSGRPALQRARFLGMLLHNEWAKSSILRRADDGLDGPALPLLPPAADAACAALHRDGDCAG